MGAEAPGLENILKDTKNPSEVKPSADSLASEPEQDTAPSIKIEDKNTSEKKETKKVEKKIDINKVALKMQEKIAERRNEQQIKALESGREEDLSPEESAALEQELRQYALDLLIKEKKKHRQDKIENSGPLVRYYTKVNKWYKGLEETPKGRVAQKFLQSGITGSLFLGTATAVGIVPPTTALAQLGTRVATATGFRALAAGTMNFLSKKRPDFVKKMTNLFSEKNSSTTEVPKFDEKNIDHTGVPKFSEQTSNTLEAKNPSIDFKKMKYAGIALGTSFVFLMGGWVAAAATGAALVSKEQLNDMLKKKIEKYEARAKELSSQIDISPENENFLANIEKVSNELDKITKTIKELQIARSVVKGTLTYANGLIGTELNLPGGGGARRLGTDQADELKINSKKVLKLEKKAYKDKKDAEKLAA